MSPLHVVLDGPKTWLEYVAPLITAVASFIAVFVAIFIAHKQNKLQAALATGQSEANASIERLKGDLQIELIRFSKLHEKRAEILADMYRRCVDVEREGRIYMYRFGKGPMNEQGEALAVEALQDFGVFAEQHRIYFSERVYQLLVGFRTLLEPYIAHARAYGDIENAPLPILMEKSEGFKKAFEAFQTDIPVARRELEREFRSILGVS
jgi:hypothetical protein